MATVTIQEAKASLSELIHGLAAGGEVLILENDKPVARLLPSPATPSHHPRKLGTLQGTVQHMAADFDAPLDDFNEYMK